MVETDINVDQSINGRVDSQQTNRWKNRNYGMKVKILRTEKKWNIEFRKGRMFSTEKSEYWEQKVI